MERLLRHRTAWIALGMTFVILVIYLSVTPNPLDVPKLGGLKTGHIMAYAWLMFWFAQIYRGTKQRLVVAVALVAMGIGLEYVQDWVGRDFAYSDMRDDAIGVAGGYLAALTPLGGVIPLLDAWWRG